MELKRGLETHSKIKQYTINDQGKQSAVSYKLTHVHITHITQYYGTHYTAHSNF